MRKFTFRLQNVLEYRQSIEEHEQEMLGKAIQKAQKEESRLERLAAEKDRQCKLAERIDLSILQQRDEHVRYIDAQINCQKEMVQDAQKVVEVCNQKLITAIQKRKMITKIKEKRLKEYQREYAQEELKILNDAGLVLYHRLAKE